MKKLLFLFIGTAGVCSANAQKIYKTDAEMGRWTIDANLKGGLSNQDYTTAPTTLNYLNALNANTGELKYKNGYAYGADAQLGFFFGKKRHFGLSAGFMYMMEQGDAILDKYHVEYQSRDFNNSIFRQVISGNDVRENLKITNLNIPVMLQYKNRFSKHWGFAAGAGALVNMQMKSAYTTHASFDYEAIYKYGTGDAANTTVYDNSPVASSNDWMITKAEFLRNNPGGNIQDYFNTKKAMGYSVGLDQPVAASKGNVSYVKNSVGLLLQPSFNYFFSDHVALNLGAYYMLQPFTNKNTTSYRLSDGSGNYGSVLNNTTDIKNQSYGLNIGARFFLGGKKKAPLKITATDQASPTLCGLCDGSMVLHGLTPDQEASIVFKLNGLPQKSYTAKIEHDGTAKITGLCAGTYTELVVTVLKKSAPGNTVILSEPQLKVNIQSSSNPTAKDVCDGYLKLGGLYAGKSATVAYSYNGAAQPAHTAIVNSDNTITLPDLCEGNYTAITAITGSCSAKVSDITLNAPAPSVPAEPVVPIVTETPKTDLTGPILFEVNQVDIQQEFVPEIDEAAQQLKANKGWYVVIDGHADITGPESHNVNLSINRANAVKKQLTKRGVNPSHIKTAGHGSSMPVESNATNDGKQQNRRATVRIVPVKH